jgi:hypothetical protein
MGNPRRGVGLKTALAGMGLLSSLLLFAVPAWAGPNVDWAVGNNSFQQAPTLEEMKHARPFINPLPPPDTRSVAPLGGDLPGKQSGDVPEAEKSQRFPKLEAYGIFGVPYTSKRVTHDAPDKGVEVDPNGLAYLSATYPYSAVGKLYFKEKPEEDFTHCSAGLILRSVIVTAAHCIQKRGKGSETYSNWTFIPAYFKRNTDKAKPETPYGSWPWKEYVRPQSWADGNDSCTGSACNNDVAVLLFEKDGEDKFIGDRTGWLRYGETEDYFVKSKRTGDLWTAALSTLGYPGDSDNGSIQQRCDGPSYLTEIGEALQIYQGSDFTGGSSGGPWVTNFGYQTPTFKEPAGPGKKSLGNVVVGVTSWGEENPDPKDNYSSRFGKNPQYPEESYGTFGPGNIGSLLNTLCSKKPEGSAQTYQELGYCDRKK